MIDTEDTAARLAEVLYTISHLGVATKRITKSDPKVGEAADTVMDTLCKMIADLFEDGGEEIVDYIEFHLTEEKREQLIKKSGDILAKAFLTSLSADLNR